MINPLLQRDEHGMFPGQAENGVPDFLNVDKRKLPYWPALLANPAVSPPATPPSWVPPWVTTSPLPDAWPL